MSTERPWYREPETFIAIAALIVSVTAVVVGVYEAALQRRHDRAEVWPHVEISTFITPKGGALYVENTGIGPALIKSVVVTVDGMPRRDWNDAITVLLGHALPTFESATVANRSLRPGDRVQMVGLPSGALPAKFWPLVERIAVRICYSSVFDDSWMVSDTKLGASSTWESRAQCPAQAPNADF